MLQLALVDVIVADREREVEAAIRRRRLLKPEAGPAERPPAARPTTDGQALAMRVRPSSG